MTAVYLIGGTTEANQAAARLEKEGYDVIVSVATVHGASLAAEATGAATEAGKKDAAILARRAAELRASAIIDCSHPFARQVSEEARSAAARAELPYLRYCRPPAGIGGPRVIAAGSWEEAVSILMDRPGRALLTVGTRHLERFVQAGIDFTARILPLAESLAECGRLGIGPQNIIAAHPPFSVEFNRACIRHAAAGILVTKESGREGGLPEKLEAAAAEDVDFLLIQRPHEAGAIHDLDTLVATLKEVIEP